MSTDPCPDCRQDAEPAALEARAQLIKAALAASKHLDRHGFVAVFAGAPAMVELFKAAAEYRKQVAP